MDPREYIPAYLEQAYLASHTDLTPAARQLVHEQIMRNPAQYAADDHARALISYGQVHEGMMRALERMDDLPDEEFDRQREQLFGQTRLALHEIVRDDKLCIDAQLLDILLADVPIDSCLNDLLKLEDTVHEHLRALPEFDDDAPAFWRAEKLVDMDEALRTRSDPTMIGWLHTLEAIAQLSLASSRYRAAIRYARCVMRARGYTNYAVGTVLLALARLEDEDGFFACVREADASLAVEDSPWFLLGRTLLLYKLGRRKNARRALRDFSSRCEGGAFFLLNPTYLTPYLPVRPAVREAWKLTHQAVWEADGIIVDTPDFVGWAASVEGIEDASERFAQRYGF